jgi:hypothetical protein
MKKVFLITMLTLVFIWNLCGVRLQAAAQAEVEQTPATQSGCNPQGICTLENPIGSSTAGTTEVTDLISKIIKSALGIMGGLTLLMFVWGGFQWLTSAGNPEKVESGTQTMVWAVIGIIVVLSSYILLSTFLDYLVQ